jgi:hypothetical protein
MAPLIDIFLLVLPWLWIAAAVIVLRRGRGAGRAAVAAFGLILAAWGVGDFFLAGSEGPPWWLILFKAGCLPAAAGALAWFHRSQPNA